MGAYSFSIPAELLQCARDFLHCRIFVETGTFHGKSSLTAKKFFEQVLTCEYSAAIRAIALKNFEGTSGITSVLSDSPNFLIEQRPKFISQSTCFWLDAHWCASPIEVGSPGQTRILEELAAIGELNETSAIFIDDARYYLAPPKPPNLWESWPDIETVMTALRRLSSKHTMIVYNDVICFFPLAHRTAFVERLFPTLVDPSESLRTIKVLARKLLHKYGTSPIMLIRRIFG